jgi:hypothetical protein
MANEVLANISMFDQTTRILTELAKNRLSQNISVFGNAIRLGGFSGSGEVSNFRFANNLRSSQYRRDPSSTDAVTPVDYSESLYKKIKIAGGFAPIIIPNAVIMDAVSGSEMNSATAEALTEVANQYADAYMLDQVNTSLACIGAGLNGVAAATLDNSAGGAIVTQAMLNNMFAKFGDKGGSIGTLAMHSGAYYQLVGNAIDDNVLDVTGMAYRNGSVPLQGRSVIVTDDPALAYNDGTRDVYKIIGLVDGAAEISNTSQTNMMEEKTGQENLYTQWQANYNFDLGIRGLSWDETNGGVFPSDAELATATNWDQIVDNVKDICGVQLIVPQAAA